MGFPNMEKIKTLTVSQQCLVIVAESNNIFRWRYSFNNVEE